MRANTAFNIPYAQLCLWWWCSGQVPTGRKFGCKTPSDRIKIWFAGHISDLKSSVVDPNDILVRIRLQIRILVFLSVADKMLIKDIFLTSFLAYYRYYDSKNQQISYCFALLMEGSGSVQIMTDPDLDPGGLKIQNLRIRIHNTAKKADKCFQGSSFPSLFLGNP